VNERSEADPLADAHALAKAHRLFIVERHDRVYDREACRYVQFTIWIVYRRAAAGCDRGVRLGKRRNPAALLRFIRQLVPAA